MINLEIGNIYFIFAPNAGYKKYHLCVFVGSENEAHKFIYLNSDDHYADSFAVKCSEIPFLGPSKTGLSVFSFSMIPKFTNHQLKIYNAEFKGKLPSKIAKMAYLAALKVKSLPKKDLECVINALSKISSDE